MVTGLTLRSAHVVHSTRTKNAAGLRIISPFLKMGKLRHGGAKCTTGKSGAGVWPA